MALNIPSYQSVYSNAPYENAYAWLSQISVDFRFKSGSFKIDVHPHYDDWGKTPVGQLTVNLGDSTDSGVVKGLEELMEIEDFRDSFFKMARILYEESLKHPVLKDANITEV